MINMHEMREKQQKAAEDYIIQIISAVGAQRRDEPLGTRVERQSFSGKINMNFTLKDLRGQRGKGRILLTQENLNKAPALFCVGISLPTASAHFGVFRE